jgi:hypothetical protein
MEPDEEQRQVSKTPTLVRGAMKVEGLCNDQIEVGNLMNLQDDQLILNSCHHGEGKGARKLVNFPTFWQLPVWICVERTDGPKTQMRKKRVSRFVFKMI